MKKFLLLFLLLPFLSIGQTIQIKVIFSGTTVTAASSSFTSLKYGKKAVFNYELDDRSSNMRDLFAYFNGGVAPIDGVAYTGKAFTDGCGNNIKWRAAVAANAKIQSNNADDAGQGSRVTWTEMANYVNNDWMVENHGYYHNTSGTFNFGTNWKENVKANHNYIYDSLFAHGVQYIDRSFVIPNADYAHLSAADAQGYIIATSQAGGVADGYIAQPVGNGEQWYWVDSLPWTRFQVDDRSLKDVWDAAAVSYYNSAIDNNFLNGMNTKAKKWHLSGHFFANTTEWGFFKQCMDHLQTAAGDNLWACSMQEYAEYREVINRAIKKESIKGNVLTIEINLNRIPRENRFRDFSLMVAHTGGTISSVQVLNADNVTYNTTTGLINVFKKKVTGFADPSPPSGGGVVHVVAPAAGDKGVYVPTGATFAAPGDTIYFSKGDYSYIYFKNLRGTPAKPIVIINDTSGLVRYTHDIKLDSCAYVEVNGYGNPRNFYGFYNDGNGFGGLPAHTGGEGISLKSLDKNITIHNIEVTNKAYTWAIKNEANELNCDPSLAWPNSYDSIDIFQIWGHQILQDGSYNGSSDPYNEARPVICGGVQVYTRPTGLKNIWVHENIIQDCFRSAIQWGGTWAGVNKVYWNVIDNCGLELNQQQGMGIAIGSAATNVEVYGNVITRTFRYGLFSYHYGFSSFHDNFVDSVGYISSGTNPDIQTMVMNTFNAENPSPTTFTIQNNTFGLNTSLNQAIAIVFYNSQNTYGTPNYICGNTYNGAALTNSNVTGVTGLSWFTTCVAGNLSPIASAGADQTITGTSVVLDGSGSYDPDGTISSYAWVKISGTGATSIPNPNNPIVTALNLVSGAYVFRLTVTDNLGATGTDDVTITVNAGSGYTRTYINFLKFKQKSSLLTLRMNAGLRANQKHLLSTGIISTVSKPKAVIKPATKVKVTKKKVKVKKGH